MAVKKISGIQVQDDGAGSSGSGLGGWGNGTSGYGFNPATIGGNGASLFFSGGTGSKRTDWGPDTDFPNQSLLPVNTSDVTQGGQVIGSINQDLISNAIRNLPGFGNYPSMQTGGIFQPTQQTAQQPQAPNPPASVRPDETGTVGSQAGTVGDGSGQVPDAPVIGGNNGGFSIGDIFGQIFNNPGNGGATPPFNPNGGGMPTGADNEQGGGFDLGSILGQIFGGGGAGQGGNAQNANIFSDLFGDVSGGNSTATGGNSTAAGGAGGSSDNALSNALSNIGNTVVNTAATDYAYDQVSDMQDDQQDFLTNQRNEDIARFQPFYDVGVNNIAGAEAAGQNNPALRDVFAGQNDINAQTNVNRQFGNSAGPMGDPSAEYTGGQRMSTGFSPNPDAQGPQGPYPPLKLPSGNTGGNMMVGAPVAYSGESQAALQNKGGGQQYGQQSGLPSLGAGNRQFQTPDSSASYTAPQAGNRSINLGDSTAVNVNQANPYDSNDPALQHVMDQGTRAIDNSAAARGKLNSGGTAVALQEFGQGAALNRARDIQAINSSQDSANLASQGQSFGQQTTNAGLSNQLNQQDFSNSFSNAGLQLGAQGQNFGQGLASAGFTNNLNQQDLGNAQGIRGQLFGEDLSGSQFDLGQAQNNISNLFNQNNQNFGQNFDANNQNFSADQQNFNQLYQLLSGGQAAAGGQVAAGQNYLSPLSNLNASQTGLAGASANNRAGGLVDLLGGLF